VNRLHFGLAVVALALLAPVVGCGGSPTAPERDQVFYLHARGVIDKRYSWERYFPPLDRESNVRLQRRVGVAVMEGDVRFSRPVDWYLRTADYTPERRLISYQSPRQFIFSIYERTDPPGIKWDDVLVRYEESVKKNGSRILASRIPFSTANAQGRSYLIQTGVAAKPKNFETFSHELLVRSRQRVLLVQIVHGDKIDDSIDEMLDALKSMLVY